jgi:hypothetical protein
MRTARGRHLVVVLGVLGAILAWSPLALASNVIEGPPFPGKPFQITKFSMETTGPTKEIPVGGDDYRFVNESEPFTQAGGHPWGLTTKLEFASEEVEFENFDKIELLTVPTRDPKDIVVSLPPGLLGNPLATPRCSLGALLKGVRCPPSTQVGVYRLRWFGSKEFLGPIINVTPEAGQSAEFSFENEVKINPVLTGHLVRTAQGYGFTVVSNQIAQVELVSVETTFWGVPADPSHDAMRGLFCGTTERSETLGLPLVCQQVTGGRESGVPAVPFLTMPTDCAAGPVAGSVRADSWEEPGHVEDNQRFVGYSEMGAEAPLPTGGGSGGFTGCNLLSFDPRIEVQPDVLIADEPVGLGVNVRVPLNEKPGALATPQLRDAVVTLPEGMSVSPGAVDGIRACDATGPEGINMTGPESEEVGLNGELQLAPGHCPDASIVGTAEAITPFLPVPVKGHVYLARPGCGGAGQGPCTERDVLDGNLYQLYLELGGTGEFSNTGIQIKVAGRTEANPATGQLTTKFLEDPQTPFSELRIHLNGGPRAPIGNPSACGPAVTTADFTPWSAPGETPQGSLIPGTADATPSSFFDVVGCASPPGFSPGFVAGTVTPQAGQFSSFTMDLSRRDREQYVRGIQLRTPPGLLAMLSSVPLCAEAQADAGTCSSDSRIGTARVASGAGSHPFEIEGIVYLTGPYCGAPRSSVMPPSVGGAGCAPFGLSIVTHAIAGPFDLGLVVVRARIDVDKDSSTARITLDENGPYAIPQIVFGVPLRLKRVTATIDRPDFMFNPTNCSAMQVSATISGSQGAVTGASSPFAVGGCKSLGFKPKFTVSTSGRTSRAKGASLDAKVSYPSGSMGRDANIASVKVSLPKQLPSRLTTLQKACPAAVFDENPAGCPGASVVGIARASTPLLPVGLSGPVYFVSHGGEAFPSLIVVLQGDNGVRVDLTGTTFISKKGITSSTFKTVPDVPVGSFELFLPEGRFSALAANGNLCKPAVGAKLVMPTEMVAQNGARLKQRTKIRVSGCRTKPGKAAAHRRTR